jgi:hypothetical protein
VVHSFDPYLARRSWYLAFYLFFGLLLLARVVYIKNRRKWIEKRTHIPPDVGFDLNRFAIMAAMVVILFAWNAPVLADAMGPAARAWQTASKPWFSLKDRFSYAFASLRASVGFIREYYGDTLALGRGNPLGDHVVMEIEGPRLTTSGSRFLAPGV